MSSRYIQRGSGSSSNVTSSQLTTMLNGKANASHVHDIANVTGLQTALDSKLASTALSAYYTKTQVDTQIQAKANQTDLAALQTTVNSIVAS